MRRSCFAFLTACLAVPPAVQAQAPAPAAEPSGPAAAPAVTPFVKANAEEAVRELATKLEEDFVFPDKGKAYATMLRANLAAGKYARFANAKDFADAVTDDLQAVHKDGHLRVHLVPTERRAAMQGATEQAPPERRGPPATLNAISKSGWLADGVAYVRFEGFPGTDATMTALRAFLDEHKDARTLIIDARSHRGGGLDEMDMLFPQLFSEETVLVDMDTRRSVDERNGDPDDNRPTLRKVNAPGDVVRREHFVIPAAQATGLRNAKVYLLTGKKTASAGEHLSLSLKRTKRATLIGETTAGAGHYGGILTLDDALTYAAFIPVGRTFDPDTGEGWEGVGVKPDVEVPADQALDEALRLAGVAKSGEAALVALK